MSEFLSYLTPEGQPIAQFAALLVFAFVSATIMLARDARGRTVSSARSPRAWSSWFFITDNFLRVVGGAPVIYFGVYFITLVIPAGSTNVVYFAAAVVVGAFGDMLWREFEKWARDSIKKLFSKLSWGK